MNRSQKITGLLAVIAILICLDFALPITTVLKLAGDEGYDLMEGLLCSKGFHLYKDIWWDQPPLLPLCLSGEFHYFGPTLAVARITAAAFGLLFFASFYCIVAQRLNVCAAMFATFFLVSSPLLLLLSLSIIQEVPTFAVALLSICLLFWWVGGKSRKWLWLSGCIMGIALGIKLTAAMVFPAVLAEIALAQADGKPYGCKRFVVAGFQWIGVTILVFSVITFLWGRGSLQIAFRSHIESHSFSELQLPETYSFPADMVFDHIECVVAAAVGIWLAINQRKLRDLAFPIIFLATSLPVHLVHRPCWSYYYVHLALPLTWLAGYAVSEFLARFSTVFSKGSSFSLRRCSWSGLVAGLLAATAATRSEKRLGNAVADIRSRQTIEANPIVRKMEFYAPKTRWVYAQEPIYPFVAHLLMPPELACVTGKRFVSRQLALSDILEIAKRYGVQQAVFDSEHIRNDWREWLRTDFIAICSDKESTLYVLKTLNP